MQDESKGNNYGMPDVSMSKGKGGITSDSGIGRSSFSRPSTLLQNNGNKVKVLESSSNKTLKVAWNPKNNMLAYGGDNEMASLWDIRDDLSNSVKISSLPHSIPDPQRTSAMYESITVTSMDWSPDGTMLITSSTDGLCRLWDREGDWSEIMHNEHSMPLKAASGYSSNGQSESKSAKPDDIDCIYDWKWNKDGSAFVTVSEKNNVILWNAEGKLRHSYQGHTDSVIWVDWKNNNQFATWSQDGVIKIWDVQHSPAIKTFNAHENGVKWIKWDYAGAVLASASEDYSVKIWSQKHDKPLFTFNDHKNTVHSLRWSPTGLNTDLENTEVRLASWSADQTVKIWDITHGKWVDTLIGHEGMVMCIDYDPSYKYIASGDETGRIIIWSVKDGTIVKSLETKSKKWIFDVQWNHDGTMLALWYDDVSVIDIRYVTELQTL